LTANVAETNFVHNWINDLQGIGCRVTRPGPDGKGARIIVDGSSEIEPPSEMRKPWNPKQSIEFDTDGRLHFVGDSAAPGNSQYYGTNSAGTKGYYSLPDFVDDEIGNYGTITDPAYVLGKTSGGVIGWVATTQCANATIDGGTY
jgi:hypothetical protein